jgi:hypothetical protein
MKKKRIFWVVIILLFGLAVYVTLVQPRLGRYHAYKRYVNHPDVAAALRATVDELELNDSPTPNVDLGYAQLYLPEGFVRDDTPNQFGVRNDQGEVLFWSPVRVPPKSGHRFEPVPESFIKEILERYTQRNESPDGLQIPLLSIDPDTLDFQMDDKYYLAYLQSQPVSPWQASGMDAEAYARHLNQLIHKVSYYDGDWVAYQYFENEHIHGSIRWMDGTPYRVTLAQVFDKQSGVMQLLQMKTDDLKLIRDVLSSLRFTLDTLPGEDEMKGLHLDAEFVRLSSGADAVDSMIP